TAAPPTSTRPRTWAFFTAAASAIRTATSGSRCGWIRRRYRQTTRRTAKKCSRPPEETAADIRAYGVGPLTAVNSAPILPGILQYTCLRSGPWTWQRWRADEDQ